MKRLLYLLMLLCAVLTFSPVHSQQPVPTSVPGALAGAATRPQIRNERLGIAHISAAEGGTGELRYGQALALGARWNRYPIYWDRIETAPGVFDWSRYDIQIADDLRHDFDINAILLGRPAFRAAETQIQGLNEPIFADGSDYPAEGKEINPANPWAVFVYETVMRYKPGGVLAKQGALGRGKGVTVWEIWNEPDFALFWSGSIPEYARLLKVAYLAAHHADPNAKVMFAGLLYGGSENWLAQVLSIFVDDPYREEFNWYIDQVAVHSYADPWRTGWLVLNVRQTLIANEIERPIWVTETGVPVWDDYPGPTWATSSSPADQSARLNRATEEQQAWFVIQSAAYAWAEGADVIIFHQLYDDCGDQPPGTDFPPHDGSLCEGGSICAGDAHGFFRNQPSSVCFSQHPEPASPRDSAAAYKLLAQVFAQPFERGKYLDLDTNAVVIEFRRRNGERIVVMWSRKLQPVSLTLPAEGENAQLVSLSGDVMIAPDEDGNYTLELPAAQPDNYPDPPVNADTAIGGAPFILIERPGGTVNRTVYDLSIEVVLDEPMAPAALTPTPGSIFGSSPRPTTDPAADVEPPVAALLPLPETSPSAFTVAWDGQDNGGIALYSVWVRIDGGAWQPWLETAERSAIYEGEAGRIYEFDLWAVDLAGNWSENTELVGQAVTKTE